MLSLSTLFRPSKTFLFLYLLSLTSVTSATDSLIPYHNLLAEGQFKELVKALDLIKQDSFTPEHYELYVSSLLKIDLDDAEDAADRAIAMYGNNADMYLLHASVMGEQAQDSIFSALSYAEKALISLEKAAELQPNNPKYLQGLMSFHLMAPSIAGGDSDVALELAKKISLLDELRGIYAFSNYYRSIDEYEKAYTNIEVGIEKFPEEISLYAQLASLFARDEQFDKAINMYIQAVLTKLDKPTDAEMLNADISSKYERDLYTLYNSHYQIGRLALEGDLRVKDGIDNLDIYLKFYNASTIDLGGLPSSDWAYLRKSALLLSMNKAIEADLALKMVKVKENDRMKKIYKKLNKKIARAIKRS